MVLSIKQVFRDFFYVNEEFFKIEESRTFKPYMIRIGINPGAKSSFALKHLSNS